VSWTTRRDCGPAAENEVEIAETVVDPELETDSDVVPKAGSEVDPDDAGCVGEGRPMYSVEATMIRAARNAAEAT